MYPDSKVQGANMGAIWGRQDPGGPHVGPMSFAIWVVKSLAKYYIFIMLLAWHHMSLKTPVIRLFVQQFVPANCKETSVVTGGFPSQMATDAETVSM